MTKSEYAKLLLTVEWDTVRKAVLKRDHYCCKRCGMGNQRLSVHHKVYLEGKMPWQVPMEYLESLCDKCHEAAHEGRLISSFVKKRLSTEPKKKKVKKEKYGTNSHEEKILIAKLCVLERLHPTSNIWKEYKKQLYNYKPLSHTEKATINKWFNKIKKSRK